jgi:hypothetical protein
MDVDNDDCLNLSRWNVSGSACHTRPQHHPLYLMPPRRTKRRTLSPSREEPTQCAHSAHVSCASAENHAIANQGSPLLYLPEELWLMLLEHLPAPDIPLSILRRNLSPQEMYAATTVDAPCALRELARACKVLRARVLPLAWRRVYACTRPGEGGRHVPDHEQLFKRCKGLVESPGVAIHVQCVVSALHRQR